MTAELQQAAQRTDARTHIGHIPALDGVRALSICLVLAAHMLPLGPKSLAFNAMSAKMGMSLFFCLSGFLIVSMIHRNPDVVTFLIRRVLRIVPAVALYLLVLVVLIDLDTRIVVINLLFVTNYFTVGLSGGPLGHMWSLSIEMQFYLAIATLTLFLGRNSVWLVLPAALVITLLRIDAGAYVNIKTHLRVDEILSGGILALIVLYHGDRLRAFFAPTFRTLWLLAATAFLWTLSCHSDTGALNYLRPYLAAGTVGIVMYCRWAPLKRALESRPAAYIARISYALYIYHMLMVWGWMNTGDDWTRYLLKRPLSFVLTFAAAHASTFWWERHWQRFARSLTRHRKDRTARNNSDVRQDLT
jgi:peptidoglycan/LPS O-acetylase OafA/YrhL